MTQLRSDYEVVTIADIYQWYKQGTLELSAKYQRNKVWNENARSYLIDSVVRGFPIPPIFMRKSFDVDTNNVTREIIDGQQRITAIVDFLSNNLTIMTSHNKEFANLHYKDMNVDIKNDILSYKLSSGVITEYKDSIVYEMFARLNSNNYVLNKQEIRNSIFWGPFKSFIYSEAAKYHDFFSEFGILKDRDFARMKDAELLNTLTIFLLKGFIQETPKNVDAIYKEYDQKFNEADKVASQIDSVLTFLEKLFRKINYSTITPFDNKNYFFTLFAVIANSMFRLNCIDNQKNVNLGDITFIDNFIQIINLWNDDETVDLGKSDTLFLRQFRDLNTKHTTAKKQRFERVALLDRRLQGHGE